MQASPSRDRVPAVHSISSGCSSHSLRPKRRNRASQLLSWLFWESLNFLHDLDWNIGADVWQVQVCAEALVRSNKYLDRPETRKTHKRRLHISFHDFEVQVWSTSLELEPGTGIPGPVNAAQVQSERRLVLLRLNEPAFFATCTLAPWYLKIWAESKTTGIAGTLDESDCFSISLLMMVARSLMQFASIWPPATLTVHYYHTVKRCLHRITLPAELFKMFIRYFHCLLWKSELSLKYM